MPYLPTPPVTTTSSLTYTMALKGSKTLKEEKMVNDLRKSSTKNQDEDEIRLQSQLLNSLQEKVAEMEEVCTSTYLPNYN